METTQFGDTDLQVSRLGVGLSEIGTDDGPNIKARAEEVLNMALDGGINFLDTAACYGNSEALLGSSVSDRREEFILSTKAGHVSGDNEAAEWAVESGLFDSLQTSFNLVDQKARRTDLLSQAQKQGMGVIAKRPIANAAWGANSSPSSYAQEYYRRARIMSDPGLIPEAPDDPTLMALGFVLTHDAIDTAIVGTSDPEHMRENLEWFNSDLPIDEQVVDELHRRFDEVGEAWAQEG